MKGAWGGVQNPEEQQPAAQEGLQQPKRSVCLLDKLQVTILKHQHLGR